MYDPVCIYTQIYIYVGVWVVYVPNSSIFSFTTTPLCYRWWNIHPGTLLRIIISCYFTTNTNPTPGRRCRRVSRQEKRKNFRPRRRVKAYYTIAAVIDLDKTSYICTLYFVKCIFPLLSFVSSFVEKKYYRFLTKIKKYYKIPIKSSTVRFWLFDLNFEIIWNNRGLFIIDFTK